MNDQTTSNSGELSDVTALTRELVRIPSLSGREGDVAALLARRMTEAGFTSVTTTRVPEDILNVYYVATKD